MNHEVPAWEIEENGEGEKSSSDMKRSNVVPKTSRPADGEGTSVGAARFTFKNGDAYEGKYRVDVDRRALVKQG